MSTSHSTWLDSNRIVMFYKIWFVYVMFWYLPWCVSDSVLVGIWQFSNRKINFYYTLFSFLFSCSLIFWYICRASFYRFLTEHRTSLGTSSPPATSVSLDNTLTYADFVLATLNNLFLLTYISLGANNFLFSKSFLTNFFVSLISLLRMSVSGSLSFLCYTFVFIF